MNGAFFLKMKQQIFIKLSYKFWFRICRCIRFMLHGVPLQLRIWYILTESILIYGLFYYAKIMFLLFCNVLNYNI